uniref:Uncharacterized protein n=1 Tax=Psilocybe cubensis TaxID=181762 RepID=A0A8H7XQW5_PSICU
METAGENGKLEPITDADLVLNEDLRRPFDVINDELAAMGGLSVEAFLNNVTSAVFDVNFHLQLPDLPSPEKESQKASKTDDPEESKSPTAANGRSNRNPITLLRHACENTFGSSEAVKYEYVETDPQNRQCILTITRPNGATRAYKSEAGAMRRADAKVQAAQIAIDMGAIDFISSGDADALKARKGLLLNPLDAIDDMELDVSVIVPPSAVLADKGPVEEIEDCCIEWRAGKVKPHWVYYNDPKNKKKHGVALRIALNAHLFRSYSVDPVHSTARAAKIACARTALNNDVLEFIRYGNGQTEPQRIIDEGEDEIVPIRGSTPGPPQGYTLQEYYETLPQPFPEDVGDMPAAEINGPAWLNLALQSARGARLVATFVPVVDSERHMHGCVLRIERPGEMRTYFVDPQFPKRGDARSAVCLLAMSQGVGDYIRELKEEAENKLPADKRKLAVEKLLPLIASESGKIRYGNRPLFIFSQERDAFGCTIKVDVSPDSDAPDVREYSTTAEYRNKADAKAAVTYLAAEAGLIDLLRFRGGELPSDYVPFWEAQMSGNGDYYVPKRKEPEREDAEGRIGKKRKRTNKDNNSDASEVSTPRTNMKPKLGSGDHPLPSKPVSLIPNSENFSRNTRWKSPHATGSRGLGPTNAHASAPRFGGQDRSGNRSGGPPVHARGYRDVSPSHTRPAPRGYSSYDDRPHYDDRAPYHDRAYYDERSEYRRDPSYRQSTPTYSRPESYANAYPPFQPPPAHGYYSSGYPPSPPPRHHHYAAYYAPPVAPPTPPHDPYGHGQGHHYSYPPGQYPPPSPVHYAQTAFPVSYPPQTPAVYNPPHPQPMPMIPPSPPTIPSHDPYSLRYRSNYPPRSPPQVEPYPPRTPPHVPAYASNHHSHPPPSPPHLSNPSYPPSYELEHQTSDSNRPLRNYRRHSTVGDTSRPRGNYYSKPLPESDNGWAGSRHGHNAASAGAMKSLSIDTGEYKRDRTASSPPRFFDHSLERLEAERTNSTSEVTVKTESVSGDDSVKHTMPPAVSARPRLEPSTSQSSVQSSNKSNYDVLNGTPLPFCS